MHAQISRKYIIENFFRGEKMSRSIKSFITTVVFTLSTLTIVGAAEINMPGFTGTINSTVTSGFSMRTDRDCLGVRGTRYLEGDTDGTYVSTVTSEQSATDLPVFLKRSEGCAKRYTDGYGNTGVTTSGARNLISANADNGRTNYAAGDIFDVTQRVYSEITGVMDTGTSVNLSFVGTYNPLIDISGNPSFAPFSSDQQSKIESNGELLNAYISHDLNEDVTITAGRFVTSWGESTFIPVGMNGLTTNALNLTALRVPGSSIKEALIPTEQITVAGYLDGGWSYEAYLQLGESHIELDEEGQFFGSDVVKGDRLIFTGQYSRNDQASSKACGYLIGAAVLAGGANQACTADEALAYYNSALGPTKDEMYLYQNGLALAFGGDNANALALKTGMLGAGAARSWGGSTGDIVQLGTTSAATVAAAFGSQWDEYTRKAGVKAGAVDLTSMGHQYADGDGQFGLALRTYLDDVGTGVDLGFYFAQYDSKVPYLRYKGQQGIMAGDLLGMFTMASKFAPGLANADALADYLANDELLPGSGAVTLTANETTGFGMILTGLSNVAYSEAACGAYQKAEAADDLWGRGTSSSLLYSDDEVQLALQANNYTVINGKLYHDSSKCATNAAAWSTASTQNAAAALLGAAVTPLNLAEYDFVYPENLTIMGMSANTNIGATTVQAELVYRPEFPLATDPSDQGLQLSDASGASTLLAQGVAKGYWDKSLTAVVENSYIAAKGDLTKTWSDALTDLKNFKRSTLPAISASTVLAGDYYTTPYIEYDVISGTVGTTSSFTASHPITTSLGADSSVLLTELGFVHVPELDYADGGVARGGYRDGVGGAKCGGITEGAGNPTTFTGAATSGGTHLGSAQTDPLFGNGNYCESNNNIDATSMTYRLVGVATYNNVANTPWTFSPSIVWSHDFSGYGPTSLGGFVPGRQSLSLTGSLSKGDVKASLNYVNQMGDEMDNLAFDQDYLSASVSYAF